MRIVQSLAEVSNVVSQLPAGVAECEPLDDGTYQLRVPSAHEAALAAADAASPRARLVTYAADARWRKQTGGITVSGIPVRTDDKTRAEIAQARTDASFDAAWTTEWKLSNGSWVTLNAATITAIHAAVSAHIRDCFATEKAVAASIASGTITTNAEIDAEFA
ncbi:MAG: DUF4376 domain-containing protein [Hyphomicrobium sp.]|nr:DUF4376 domain-containing protein [Hyphomicrobium sp.]